MGLSLGFSGIPHPSYPRRLSGTRPRIISRLLRGFVSFLADAMDLANGHQGRSTAGLVVRAAQNLTIDRRDPPTVLGKSRREPLERRSRNSRLKVS
jgi:hypothetical protein